MCSLPPKFCYQQMDLGLCECGLREDRIKHPFCTMSRINPLGSTVSITSMLYCIYRLVLLLWV
ncbi:unnamed protein product [Staurois parvus]|uniref:Uncharacterized protein n=1 Tax=Staurois parvus TaxID=386267 RepID=A0ABN9GXM4_9NEOB|nr:unnamed protein product [Staurois parvus]